MASPALIEAFQAWRKADSDLSNQAQEWRRKFQQEWSKTLGITEGMPVWWTPPARRNEQQKPREAIITGIAWRDHYTPDTKPMVRIRPCTREKGIAEREYYDVSSSSLQPR